MESERFVARSLSYTRLTSSTWRAMLRASTVLRPLATSAFATAGSDNNRRSLRVKPATLRDHYEAIPIFINDRRLVFCHPFNAMLGGTAVLYRRPGAGRTSSLGSLF